jgi:hypothetical protein
MHEHVSDEELREVLQLARLALDHHSVFPHSSAAVVDTDFAAWRARYGLGDKGRWGASAVQIYNSRHLRIRRESLVLDFRSWGDGHVTWNLWVAAPTFWGLGPDDLTRVTGMSGPWWDDLRCHLPSLRTAAADLRGIIAAKAEAKAICDARQTLAREEAIRRSYRGGSGRGNLSRGKLGWSGGLVMRLGGGALVIGTVLTALNVITSESAPSRPDAVEPAVRHIELPMTDRLVNTGILVRRGQKVLIRCSGSYGWTGEQVDTEWVPVLTDCGGGKVVPSDGIRTDLFLAPDAPVGSLVAFVANEVHPLVSEGFEFRARKRGYLRLGPNLREDRLWERSGSLSVRVELY